MQFNTPAIPNFLWVDHTTAFVSIKNGVLEGRGLVGTNWSAVFTLNRELNTVSFSASVDTENAPANTFVLDANGQPTKTSQNYKGSLNITSVGNQLSLYGSVQHGVINININLKRKQ